jgi:hypothetical protein
MLGSPVRQRIDNPHGLDHGLLPARAFDTSRDDAPVRACCEIIDSQEKNRWMPDNAGKESQIEWVVEVQAIHWNGDRLQRDSDAL